MRYEIWKGRKSKGGFERIKRYTSAWFTIWAIEADILRRLCYSMCHPSYISWLTDISSNQRSLPFLNLNASSNYTYLFRFVWFVVVFSELLYIYMNCCCVFWFCLFFLFAFAFVICYFVFRIVIFFVLLGHRTTLKSASSLANLMGVASESDFASC